MPGHAIITGGSSGIGLAIAKSLSSRGASISLIARNRDRLAVAREAVAAYLYQPTWITVANARVKGLWKDMPVFVNDLAAISWQ